MIELSLRRLYVHNDNDNDNDDENNFIVMNYIGTMTALDWIQQGDISRLQFSFGIAFWNSWQRGHEASAYRPQHLLTLFTLGCRKTNDSDKFTN